MLNTYRRNRFLCTDILTEETYYHGKTNEKAPFSKIAIAVYMQNRLKYPYPNQDRASLCGPAAFYYCLLKDRPDIYEKMTWILWKYGKIKVNKLTIMPSDDCKHPDNIEGISNIDWITLASLRDSSNIFFDYDSVSDISDQIAGMTAPNTLVDWFNKIGASFNYDNTSLFFNRKLSDLIKLNEYYNKNLHVLIFIASKILGTDSINTKDHWVVLASKIEIDNKEINDISSVNGIINARFFSWGEFRTFKIQVTLKEFLECFYGGLVFFPIN